MTNEEFEKLVAAGVNSIPKRFLEKLDNVSIVIADEPTAEQRQKFRLGKTMTLFGLYEGVPQTSRGFQYGQVLPDKITIFKNPILAAATSPDHVHEIVRDTAWHEIAHHFGMDEKRVRRAEQRRKK